jgi:hypothetical protein
MKWYEESEGVVSAMRIMAMIAVCAGVIVCMCGAVGMLLHIPESVAIAGSGAGVIGVAIGAKAYQTKNE